MKTLGLIGKKLGHSFSKGYFKEKFEKLHLSLDFEYKNFELAEIEAVKTLFENESLIGFNVTIPYKTEIIPFLDKISPEAKAIGAVNTVKKLEDGSWCGYNTDVIGFEIALKEKCAEIGNFDIKKALILGSGGAAKAVTWVLEKNNIEFEIVSRQGNNSFLSYAAVNEDLLKSVQLIVNTTPLGMYPKVDECPAIAYEYLNQQHLLYDLIYNPAQTLFLEKGSMAGSYILNGHKMLIQQAEAAWSIWQNH